MTGANELFEGNMAWATELARRAHRQLPRSFALDDLTQEAHIALWKQATKFDACMGVPFRAFAYRAVVGAMFMTVRRKNYAWSTAGEVSARMVDSRATADVALIEKEFHRRERWRSQKRLQRLAAVVAMFPPDREVDAQLLRRVYWDGESLEEVVDDLKIPKAEVQKRLAGAVRLLKRLRRAK